MLKNSIFILLVFNLLLVVLGYALALFTAGDSLILLQWIKSILLMIGILFILKLPYSFLKATARNFYPHLLFGLFLIGTAIYAEEPVHSLLRTLTFFIPFAYIYFSLAYLIAVYSYRQVFRGILYAINGIYSIPLLCFLLFAQTTSYLNIYYLKTDPYTVFGYASNQYGWASCMVLVTGLDLLRNARLKSVYKLFFGIMCVFAVYLILASGNRASWLVLIIGMISMVFFNRRVRLFRKILLLGFPLGMGLWMSQISDSSLKIRVDKTYEQLEVGESRWLRTANAVEYANTEPLVWVIGWGMFSPPEELRKNMHNSYLEVLFGAGLFVFCYFLWQFLIKPCLNFYRYFSESNLFLIPVVIIPYFESNLTGGQFLFFPWFIFILLAGEFADAVIKSERPE